MPIKDITQPEVINIDEHLRLRRYDGKHDFAIAWYQDQELVRMIDGDTTPYSVEKVKRMYDYLERHGELYFIEVKEQDVFIPIGDVTFWQEDMPIVIGEIEYRSKGIGKKVVHTLIERARQIGYEEIFVGEIFDFNIASRKCFESMGFRECGTTTLGHRYCLVLTGQDE